VNFVLGEVVVDLLDLIELFLGNCPLVAVLNPLTEVIHLSYFITQHTVLKILMNEKPQLTGSYIIVNIQEERGYHDEVSKHSNGKTCPERCRMLHFLYLFELLNDKFQAEIGRFDLFLIHILFGFFYRPEFSFLDLVSRAWLFSDDFSRYEIFVVDLRRLSVLNDR
jgi:hypothetical protein